MSNNQESKRLTLEDPAAEEVVQKFQQIEEAQASIGMELLRLEKRRIFLLASSKRLEEEHGRLFGMLLIERGLAPNLAVELDVKTRRLTLKEEPKPPGQPPEEPPTTEG